MNSINKLNIMTVLFVSFLLLTSDCMARNSNNKLNKEQLLKEETRIIDHNCIDVRSLTDAEIAKAKKIKIYFEHASVGSNISKGLNNLISENSRYDRANIFFYPRGNPGAKAKIDDFFTRLTDAEQNKNVNPKQFDIVMMKLCYIDSRVKGFESTRQMFEYYRNKMNSLEKQFPRTKFIWWTMPVRTTGDINRDSFNTLVRNYCRANGKMLFDIADIECHDENGFYLTDNKGEVLNKAYTSDGGHLNDAGSVRVAKAIWWMLARIA